MNNLKRNAGAFEATEQATTNSVPTNSIFTIEPYKMGNIYVFDVPQWGVIAEAFVAGAETYLGIISGDAERITATFSSLPFPNAHRVDIIEEDGYGGTWYYSEEFKHKLWLCSFLHRFYPKSPDSLYVQVKPL